MHHLLFRLQGYRRQRPLALPRQRAAGTPAIQDVQHHVPQQAHLPPPPQHPPPPQIAQPELAPISMFADRARHSNYVKFLTEVSSSVFQLPVALDTYTSLDGLVRPSYVEAEGLPRWVFEQTRRHIKAYKQQLEAFFKAHSIFSMGVEKSGKGEYPAALKHISSAQCKKSQDDAKQAQHDADVEKAKIDCQRQLDAQFIWLQEERSKLDANYSIQCALRSA